MVCVYRVLLLVIHFSAKWKVSSQDDAGEIFLLLKVKLVHHVLYAHGFILSDLCTISSAQKKEKCMSAIKQ